MIDSRKISILSITSELPWPLDTGGKIRTYHLQHALAQEFHVRLIASVDTPDKKTLSHLEQKQIQVLPVQRARRRLLPEACKVLNSARVRKPYILYRRHLYSAVIQKIKQASTDRTPDILFLDHLDSLQYRTLLPQCPAVLDLHNIYSVILKRYTLEQTNFLRKKYFQRETRLLEQVERTLADHHCMVFAVSEPEVQFYQNLGVKNVHLIPNGVDCSELEELPIGREHQKPKILFLGTMSWGPNTEAAFYLIKHIFPIIRAKRPDAELWIVGRNPPADLQHHHGENGVFVTGGVPEVGPYFRDAQLLAVPLESGGGTRLKILEAFAAGLPVVSTGVGAEGIDALDHVHLTIATRENFAKVILDLLEKPAVTREQAQRARKLVQEKYDWRSIGCDAVQRISDYL
ncbi:MAG TPA: glycosyltransferase family 4 protein [Gemmatales bacterium]|mgnify:FL=1|nr:glycosyltransferase family 4 protein [Gemmatales bacterium]